ncbi:retrovirus-related pol polyprotein from transposon TNT 1-94 [Tanacetum coccineum]|uniref:Retrovirus-related pol polyprotein from transposon TNT 1-94 n=1 Tax=Tanacetum coccineum TaxID=301880 RepID=A0ABQ4ZFD8_9ASTR
MGLHQAPRAWYETLLTYLLDNEFQRGKIDKTLFINRYKGDILLVQVYVDDIIFGSTKKELCNAFEKLMHEKFQMSSMGELILFLGLQVDQKKDGIFISQDKYVGEILKKFGFTEVKTASTPMETQKPLLKDEDEEEVDVHMYRSMIGSLMYLTSSRPDIMFAVLKGQPKLSLWYPKDSPFDLVAYTDSDYAGASLDRKSTTGGCQFLGCRLISWQFKKQTVVANSTIEAEYVAASSCCSPVVQQTGYSALRQQGIWPLCKGMQEAKAVKDLQTNHKENMMMCKQAEQGVPLQAEQADWLADTDKEIDGQELEAHYSFMVKIQEVLPKESSSTKQPLEHVQNNDENNVFANKRQHFENNTTECADERAALANLIANLTLDTEENKTILKQLKKANTLLTQEIEECKTNLDETSRALGEATSCRNSCLIALQNKQNELREDLKAQMQDKNITISELKKLIEKCKGKSVETQFDKPSVVRQPNAQRIPKPSVLGKPTPFSNSLEMRSFQTKQSVNKTNVSDGLFKQVTQQNLPQNRKQAEIHSNVLKPGMYRIATTTTQNREPQLPHASRNTNPHVSKSSGVNHTTSVSRPQLKSYQVKDKVVPNNSQVKFNHKEVEEHHRISSISRKTKSVTACNDSSKSRTLNVNAVCAECGKCVFNSNHDACVSRYLNDVNARTKKPKVVPISASKPKRKANKSVATPHKKTVASDTTIQKSKSYYKELYENTNQEWKWWIAKKMSHQDGDNLDKMKEKGNPWVMVDIRLRSKGYRGLQQENTLNIESIHIKFDEIKEMMSDHNSSDLAPQRQEMSVENVSSGLIPQGQKASDYDNSDPVPPRQNVVPTAEKTDSSQQGLEFLFSPLLEEYYNPTHGLAEENNNDQAPNASVHQDDFFNPFCTRVQEIGESSVQEIGESSSRNIDNTDVHSFQPQSHDYRWTRDHPLEQVRGNPTMPVQTRRQLATDPEMCMFALTVSIVEPKNIKEAMADSAWIGSNSKMNFIIRTD